MTADLNETGLILMAFPLHVARLYDRTIIVLLISKCVDKEVIQGIGGFFFFISCIVACSYKFSFNSEVMFISELCASRVICGPFVRLDVQGKQMLSRFLPV